MDLDNVESVLRFREARGFPVLGRWRWMTMFDAARLSWFQRRLLPSFDKVWVCSDLDRRRLARSLGEGHVQVVPNGVDIEAHAAIAARGGTRSLIFVGDMTYDPNEDAVLYFCEKVLPLIRKQDSEVQVVLVGRPSQRVQALPARLNRVMVTGIVPDVRPYLESASVSIAPIRAGGGTRLKILEAMAAGRPVVSTSIGAEGLEAVAGRDLLIADKPRDFAQACLRLLRSLALRQRVAASGRACVRSRYDWSVVHDQVRQCYASLPVRGGRLAPAVG